MLYKLTSINNLRPMTINNRVLSISKAKSPLSELCTERIIILDGAIATMIQLQSFCEAYFNAFPVPLQGCNDLLCLSQP